MGGGLNGVDKKPKGARLFGYDYIIGITADNSLFSIEYAKGPG